MGLQAGRTVQAQPWRAKPGKETPRKPRPGPQIRLGPRSSGRRRPPLPPSSPPGLCPGPGLPPCPGRSPGGRKALERPSRRPQRPLALPLQAGRRTTLPPFRLRTGTPGAPQRRPRSWPLFHTRFMECRSARSRRWRLRGKCRFSTRCQRPRPLPSALRPWAMLRFRSQPLSGRLVPLYRKNAGRLLRPPVRKDPQARRKRRHPGTSALPQPHPPRPRLGGRIGLRRWTPWLPKAARRNRRWSRTSAWLKVSPIRRRVAWRMPHRLCSRGCQRDRLSRKRSSLPQAERRGQPSHRGSSQRNPRLRRRLAPPPPPTAAWRHGRAARLPLRRKTPPPHHKRLIHHRLAGFPWPYPGPVSGRLQRRNPWRARRLSSSRESPSPRPAVRLRSRVDCRRLGPAARRRQSSAAQR